MVLWTIKNLVRNSGKMIMPGNLPFVNHARFSSHVPATTPTEETSAPCKFPKRSDLSDAKRLIVKLGSAVLTRTDQSGIALGRLASIVEQVAELKAAGKQVIIVTSGSVALGRQQLGRIAMSVGDSTIAQGLANSKTCAAAVGQNGLMSLYDSMFAQYSITTAQVLISRRDFDMEHRETLHSTIDNLLALSVVPIINTNDAAAPVPDSDDGIGAIQISDNDSLAARLAVQTETDLLVLMSNVDGLFTGPPGAYNSKLIPTYCPSVTNDVIKFGAKSSVGLGGMDTKVDASVWCLNQGTSVVICNGCSAQGGSMLTDIVEGKEVGTFFTNTEPEVTSPMSSENHQGKKARSGSRKLQQLSGDQRREILHSMADLLLERQDEIMDANMMDVAAAKKTERLSSAMVSRLGLSAAKLHELADGIRQVADHSSDLLGKVILRRQLATDLIAEQVHVPIGVVLVIFESRPDCLPQIASLAIATGNGVLLKGGVESANTNKCLHKLVQDALSKYDCADAAQLVETREETANLIENSQGFIDLIIPRGSYDMVRSITQKAACTGVPVLGHSEGICHVYVDRDCTPAMACSVVRDSKCNYPAACNSMETLLVHKNLLHNSIFQQLSDVLEDEGVKIHLGPKIASELVFPPSSVASLNTEYSGLECCIEVVDDIDGAIEHIEKYGSAHTDTIVTDNDENAEYFLRNVDSACVFHNASTRFSDGQRMGLGAEVGVSTTRIHARGPVGSEGLLTYKWIVQGDGHIVQDFSADGTKKFDYKDLPLGDSYEF